MKHPLMTALAGALLVSASYAQADDYIIDTKNAHAFIQFKIKHLGFSWLYGQFTDFSGEFTFDEKNPAANKIAVEVKVASVDSQHAERDKHLRSKDFLNVEAFPSATFVSTEYKKTGEKSALLTGNFTLHGVTKKVSLPVEMIGQGSDPWGGYRAGFEGKLNLKPADFNIDLTKKLGPAAAEFELTLSFEGIRKTAAK